MMITTILTQNIGSVVFILVSPSARAASGSSDSKATTVVRNVICDWQKERRVLFPNFLTEEKRSLLWKHTLRRLLDLAKLLKRQIYVTFGNNHGILFLF